MHWNPQIFLRMLTDIVRFNKRRPKLAQDRALTIGGAFWTSWPPGELISANNY